MAIRLDVSLEIALGRGKSGECLHMTTSGNKLEEMAKKNVPLKLVLVICSVYLACYPMPSHPIQLPQNLPTPFGVKGSYDLVKSEGKLRGRMGDAQRQKE